MIITILEFLGILPKRGSAMCKDCGYALERHDSNMSHLFCTEEQPPA